MLKEQVIYFLSGCRNLFKSCLIIFILFFNSPAIAAWKVESGDKKKDIDSEVVENIKLHLAGLSFPDDDYKLVEFEKQVRSKVTKAVRAFSYYQFSLELKDFNKKSFNNKNAIIVLKLGEKLTVDSVNIEIDGDSVGEAHFPTELKDIIDSLKKLKGKPFDHSKYEGLKSRIQSFALIFGYFDFLLEKNQVKVSLEKNQAQIDWKLHFGSRYRFGQLIYLSENKGSALVNSVKPFEEGAFFDQQKISEFTQQIRQTAYYDNVLARANINAMNEQNKLNKTVPIELLLKTKPRDTYQFGVGASTDSGPRFTANWKRPWVNLRGHSMSSELYLSDPKKNVSLAYTIPMANPLNDFLKIQMGYQELNEEQRDTQTYTLAAQRQWGAKNQDEWDKIGFVRYEYENFVQGLEVEKSTQLLLPGITFNRVRKSGDLFIDWGDRQQFTLEAGSESMISDINIVRAIARTKWIRTFAKHRWILRGEAGAIVTNDFEKVPSTLRFFIGGDQSVRGFGLNKVSEERIDDVSGLPELIGARFLAVASTEYAYQVSDNWRAAVFFDVGSADNDFGKSPVYGVGAGTHWLSPIGTVRIYIARGFNEDERTWRLHFSIGPGL